MLKASEKRTVMEWHDTLEFEGICLIRGDGGYSVATFLHGTNGHNCGDMPPDWSPHSEANENCGRTYFARVYALENHNNILIPKEEVPR